VTLWKSPRFRWLVPLALVAVCLAAYPVWLRALGNFLVKADPPFPAEMIVVLAGDRYGYRIVKAGELVRQGFAPEVLVSGPEGLYGLHECDLAIPFAKKQGYPAAWFIPLPHDADSTVQEARVVVQELRRRQVRRFMVVTSDYHTRRAGRVYRSLAPPAQVRIVAAPDRFFRADSWWRTRQGRKLLVLEWQKTLANWLGM
jgi:uncharacterized SAM-binding protein YcdF (DUF218 family)